MEALVDLISKTVKLIHIDLSECGLSELICRSLLKPIRNSVTLIGVHLSGNPGMNADVEHMYVSKLNATYEPPLKLDSFQQALNRDLRQQVPVDETKQDMRIMQSLFLKQTKLEKRIEVGEGA